VAKSQGVSFESVKVDVGSGASSGSITVSGITVTGEQLEQLLKALSSIFPADAPVQMSFKKANFPTGHDLSEFAQRLGIDIQAGDLVQ